MFSWIWGSTDQKDKENHSLPEESQKERYDEFLRVKNKYPDWIPIIVESNVITLNKTRYLTKKHIPFKSFAEIVRQYCVITTPTGTQAIDPSMPLLLIANETMIPPEEEMGKIYDIHKKNDGFLHITLYTEPDWVAPDFSLPVKTITIEEYPQLAGNVSPYLNDE